jgi:hypothetical protein
MISGTETCREPGVTRDTCTVCGADFRKVPPIWRYFAQGKQVQAPLGQYPVKLFRLYGPYYDALLHALIVSASLF